MNLVYEENIDILLCGFETQGLKIFTQTIQVKKLSTTKGRVLIL